MHFLDFIYIHIYYTYINYVSLLMPFIYVIRLLYIKIFNLTLKKIMSWDAYITNLTAGKALEFAAIIGKDGNIWASNFGVAAL